MRTVLSQKSGVAQESFVFQKVPIEISYEFIQIQIQKIQDYRPIPVYFCLMIRS